MEFPTEILCKIIGYLTDPRDVSNLLVTNSVVSSITRRAIEALRYDGRSENIPTRVNVDLVLNLRHLRIVEPYIHLNEITDIILIAQMPHLSHASFDFVNVDLDSILTSHIFPQMMMEMFLSAFHRSRHINDDGRLVVTTRYVQPQDRFCFRCLDNVDIIVRGDSFGFLSTESNVEFCEDKFVYYSIASPYIDELKLVLNVASDLASVNFLVIKELHCTPNIDDFVDDENITLLDLIAYMAEEGLLRKVKMYMPKSTSNGKFFDRGYFFDPSNIRKEDFPATNEIELDIPFVLSEDIVRDILEWFPKVTLIGLYMRDCSQLGTLSNVRDLLREHNVRAKIYTTVMQEYHGEHMDYVEPKYIDIFNVI